ncbi:MAG: site-specific tyrosine recombinase XerC [Candidatus Ozemobacteraceae bacterium]
MARKPTPWPRTYSLGSDPRTMKGLLAPFVEYMRVRGFSEFTIHRRFHNLKLFFDWCDMRSLTDPQEVTRPMLERYQRYLYHYRSADGKPLGLRTQHIYLSTVRAYFRFLARKNFILNNPAADLDMPRYGKQIPRNILTVSEVEQIMSVPNIKTALGLRDRAMLETLYSTGIRRLELIKLTIYDLEIKHGTLMVKEGKCRMDRLLPIGDRALAWIQKYLQEARPRLVMEPDEGALFLRNTGGKLTPSCLGHIVTNLVTKSGVNKKGSCHMFRHTMATLMLEGGADVRFIQRMLGHARLETTSIYTHVSIQKLKEVHRKTHPGAALKRKRRKKPLKEKINVAPDGEPRP